MRGGFLPGATTGTVAAVAVARAAALVNPDSTDEAGGGVATAAVQAGWPMGRAGLIILAGSG